MKLSLLPGGVSALRLLLVSLPALPWLASAACSVEPIVPDFGDLPASDGGAEGGGARVGPGPGSDAAAREPDAAPRPEPTKPAQVRLVHAGFQTGGIDFCLKPAQGATLGPVFAGVAVPTGLEEGEVSNHVELTLGTWEAIVFSDGGTCDGRSIGKVTFEAKSGSVTTVALYGNYSEAKVVALPDAPAPPAAGLHARVVNLLSGVSAPVDVYGAGATPGATPLFPGIAPGSAARTSSAGSLSPEGYLADAASKVSELTALYKPSAASSQQREAFLDIAQTTGAATAFLVGYPASGFFPVGGRVCDDAVVPLTTTTPRARCVRP